MIVLALTALLAASALPAGIVPQSFGAATPADPDSLVGSASGGFS